MFIARAVCGVTSARVAALCSNCSLQVISNGERHIWMRNECGNEETHNHGSRIPYISLVTTLFTVYAQYTLVHLTWGLLRVRAACPTLRLNLKFELRPSWNNIHRARAGCNICSSGIWRDFWHKVYDEGSKFHSWANCMIVHYFLHGLSFIDSMELTCRGNIWSVY